ncbi:MAG TPA: hypothetical protein VK668_04995 [Mucilaginibacter sp.]|nr:hypothetical protein [Mucilaginibacter sp.]
MKANIELKQARDFGEIISDCILFIKQNWKSLTKTYFVFCGFFIAGNMLFSILLRMKMINLHQGQLSGHQTSAAAVFGLEYFMVLIFGFLNIISATLSLLSYIALYNEQGKKVPTISQVWGYYKYYFWRVVGHSLLLFLIFFIGFLIILIPVFLIFSGRDPFISGVILIVCLMVPVIYFLTVFSLFFPIVIIENGSFGYAFGKSFKLIRGKWWNTFGVVFVVAIIVYAGFLLVLIPFSVASGGVITFLSYNVSLPLAIAYTVCISLVQVLNIVPLTASSVTYFSYIEDKEGAGLFERIDAIGKTVEDIDPATNEEY